MPRLSSPAIRLLFLLALVNACAASADGPTRVDADECGLALDMTDVCYENSLRLKASCEQLRFDLVKELKRRGQNQPGFPEFCATVCTAARKQIPREKVRETIAREMNCG